MPGEGAWLGAEPTWVPALHSCPQNCSQLIQTIEDTGSIMREVRDLEEQVRPGVGVMEPEAAQGRRPGPTLFCLCAELGQTWDLLSELWKASGPHLPPKTIHQRPTGWKTWWGILP